MTDLRDDGSSLTKRATRAALGPIFTRLDQVRAELIRQDEERVHLADDLGARLEQQSGAIGRLEAYIDSAVTEVRNEASNLRHLTDAVSSLLVELGVGADASAGAALHDRLATIADETGRDLRRDIGDLRATTRLTQSLVERALAGPPSTTSPAAEGPSAVAGTPAAPPSQPYEHPTPTFDLLYRAFEDRHRGSLEEITERVDADYLQLLSALPNADLPIADLGCGRGELVRLLADNGQAAVGVDVNTGQVADDDQHLLVEDDLFRWLDRQPDGSLRAATAAHVVEHLPTDLQIRLVFEAHRVVAPGGVLVLETPNALSLSTAATNFWVDPTHERPVHPLFLEFLAHEAGFARTRTLPLHPVALAFHGTGSEPQLVDDLNSLIFGHGDVAFVAHR